ncbi:HAMP domain protein, partial [Chlamydia psittaci 84-8471/1]|jgi:syntaxin-binding protein 1
MIP